jgi:ribonucleoside-diphosphate reductase alpha chain
MPPFQRLLNVPEDYTFAAFRGIYDAAYDMGLKGCTTFRPNPITGSVFTAAEQMSCAPHCCALEREAD